MKLPSWLLKTNFCWSTRGIAFGIVILVVGGLNACARPTGRVAENPLTEEEMAIPKGAYQRGVDMWHRARVRMPSPHRKPILSWHVELPFVGDTSLAFVDSEGGTWYRTGPSILMQDRIVRIRPDGNRDWERRLAPEPGSVTLMAEPTVVIEGAVVCTAEFIKVGSHTLAPGAADNQDWSTGPAESAYLECLDLQGNTRWRTETFQSDDVQTHAWRLPENRIAAAAGRTTLLIFSLADGSLLQTLSIPEWWPSDSGPLPTDDGGFILCGSHNSDNPAEPRKFMEKIAQDGSPVWTHDFQEDSYVRPPCLSEDNVVATGYSYGIVGMDADTGRVKWQSENWHGQAAIGVNYLGELVSWGFEAETGPTRLRFHDADGRVLRYVSLSNANLSMSEGAAFLIYEDNNMLVGFRNGFALIDPEGNTLWSVTSTDLGYTSERKFHQWSFNPEPDGGIVVYVVDSTEKWNDHIFGLIQ